MKLGNIDITDIKIGSTPITKVMQGNSLVWELDSFTNIPYLVVLSRASNNGRRVSLPNLNNETNVTPSTSFSSANKLFVLDRYIVAIGGPGISVMDKYTLETIATLNIPNWFTVNSSLFANNGYNIVSNAGQYVCTQNYLFISWRNGGAPYGTVLLKISIPNLTVEDFYEASVISPYMAIFPANGIDTVMFVNAYSLPAQGGSCYWGLDSDIDFTTTSNLNTGAFAYQSSINSIKRPEVVLRDGILYYLTSESNASATMITIDARDMSLISSFTIYRPSSVSSAYVIEKGLLGVDDTYYYVPMYAATGDYHGVLRIDKSTGNTGKFIWCYTQSGFYKGGYNFETETHVYLIINHYGTSPYIRVAAVNKSTFVVDYTLSGISNDGFHSIAIG